MPGPEPDKLWLSASPVCKTIGTLCTYIIVMIIPDERLIPLLGCRYPIIQAPMLGITSPEMVAAAIAAGAAGSLPVGGLSPERTRELIRATRKLTSAPFTVNLFTYDPPVADPEGMAAMNLLLRSVCTRHGIPFEPASPGLFAYYSYKDQVQVLLDEKVSSASFTFGIPDDALIDALKRAGVCLTGTATAVDEAILLAEKDIDIIVVQGIEAGGHRGSFLAGPLPQVGLLPLLSQVLDRVSKPVVAAGGIYSGSQVKMLLQYGAAGVQVGTILVPAMESLAIPAYKEAVLKAKDVDSTLTRSFSGRWARGLRNTFMEEVDSSGLNIPAYPFQNYLTTAFRAAMQKENNKEWTNLWAGQSAGRSQPGTVQEILAGLTSVLD